MNAPSTQTIVQTHHQDHVQIQLEVICVPADLDTREMERHVLVRFLFLGKVLPVFFCHFEHLVTFRRDKLGFSPPKRKKAFSGNFVLISVFDFS